MKAIILAAGMGTRLGKYTKHLPKGMLVFNGKTLIEFQLETLRKVGIYKIAIVTGYQKEAISYPGLKYYYNEYYSSTNMVESLMATSDEFDDDIIVAYSDIIYTDGLAREMINAPFDIAVAADCEWRRYWNMRYGTTEIDVESFSVGDDLKIKELGLPLTSSEGVDYRYIGLIKFSQNGIFALKKVYEEKKRFLTPWKQSGKNFYQGYMTDILNELIINKYDVYACLYKNGWLEFDTVEDYEKMCQLQKTGKLSSLLKG